ncbi:MAG: methionyl-tRNA formyltransferase [Bacteroidetes bacterium]|nr:MAG: methionyl-tRNA formyltransferase [Bacteroidota bacterium]
MAVCRIAFVGCVKEGKECLQEILDAGGEVVAIFTFTDEIAAKTSGAVSFVDISKKYNTPLYKIKNTNTPETAQLIKEINPDVIFVIGWTRLVNAEILAIPKYGCIGMHASLLPKYRGRAPVNWALINNEKITGNTMILLDDGVDTGDILLQRSISITLADTCGTLYDKVAKAGREMIREIIPHLQKGDLPRKHQNHDEATVMPKRTPEDGLIDWNKSALEIFNWIRALTHPYPGAFTYYQNKKLFIWDAQIAHFPAQECNGELLKNAVPGPGTVISMSDGIAVSTGGNEILSLRYLNFEDSDKVIWKDFLSANELTVGDILS